MKVFSERERFIKHLLNEEQKANFRLLIAGFCRKFATLVSDSSKLPDKKNRKAAFSVAWMKLLSNFRPGKSSQERLIVERFLVGQSHKLHAIGISGSLHEWLMSYLTDRRQFTEVNNCRSTTDFVRYGVPQGSLLGPRLYTIYVSDLPDHIDSGDLYMYADDTTVYCIGPNVDLE